MSDALQVNGVPHNHVAALTDSFAGKIGKFIKECQTQGGSSFAGEIWPYKFVPSVATEALFFELTPVPAGGLYGEMLNGTGVPGQNSLTPSQKLFADHALLFYPVCTPESCSGKYYDPSYGLAYTSDTEFREKAVVGYVKWDRAKSAHVVKIGPRTQPVELRVGAAVQ